MAMMRQRRAQPLAEQVTNAPTQGEGRTETVCGAAFMGGYRRSSRVLSSGRPANH